MTSHTNISILDRAGIAAMNIEFPDLEVPVLTGNQRQGDVYVLRATSSHIGLPIGAGVAVVEAESNSANTHVLVGEGLWQAAIKRWDSLVQGWLTVPEGSEAFLIHTEEHNALGIGPGTYEIRRQREWDGWRWHQVAD